LRAVEVFHKLASRDGKRGRERYVRDLVDVVKKERVDIWVNCRSGDVNLEVKYWSGRWDVKCYSFQQRA
jgi:hypothetical protein